VPLAWPLRIPYATAEREAGKSPLLDWFLRETPLLYFSESPLLLDRSCVPPGLFVSARDSISI